MKRRKWLKTTGAMLAAVSMLMGNAQAAMACPQDYLFCWGQDRVVEEEVILDDSNSSVEETLGEADSLVVEGNENEVNSDEIVVNEENNDVTDDETVLTSDDAEQR